MRSAIVLLCFFLSGFAGLTYQICWIRKASLVFGSTTYAVSTVVAVFFLGLALGSEFFGRIAQRSRSPLRIYAGVEIAIGLLGLSSLAAFGWIDSLYGHFYRELGDRVGMLTAVRVGLVSLALLAPTFLMGGTLPLFCRQFVVDASGIASKVGFLYGVNTLGAAVGAASTGLYLIPVIGLEDSIRLGAAISIATGVTVGALRAARLGSVSSAPLTPNGGRPRWGALPLLFFATGFVALGTEVLWTRYLALLVHHSVLSYTLPLTAVLVGIVIGAIVAAPFLDRSRSRAVWFGAFQVLSGLLVFALLKLPYAAWEALDLGFATYFLVPLLAAVFSGASFPLVIRMVVADPRYAGAGVGRMTALNTLGGIAGSLTVGFLTLPWLGVEASLRLVTGLAVAIGVTAWLWVDPGQRRLGIVLSGVAAAVWLAIPLLLTTRVPADFLAEPGRLVAFREGAAANVAVIRTNGALDLEIDRLWQGRNQKTQQVMAAHIPMLLHPEPHDVLLVGVGAGLTASRFLMYDIDRLTCVEIEPAVFDLLRAHFDTRWMDDDRVELVFADGRNHVAHSNARYDIISLEVGQVFRPGVGAFYTADFYDLARARLQPGGLLAQFVPIPSFTVEQFQAVIRTFVAVFPQSQLWYNRNELLLIGVNAPAMVVDLERVESQLGREPVHDDLRFSPWGEAKWWLNQPNVFLGSFLTGTAGLHTLAQGALILRDDQPVLEYGTAESQRRFETHELEIIELLQSLVMPVASVIPTRLSTRDQLAIRRTRLRNIDDLKVSAMLRRARLVGEVDPDKEREILKLASWFYPENVHPRQRLNELE